MRGPGLWEPDSTLWLLQEPQPRAAGGAAL